MLCKGRPMDEHLCERILELTGARAISSVELIQPLWNNYGTLSRAHLVGAVRGAVIVKHIQVPAEVTHPRGFASSISRDRKLRSYSVEATWYQRYNAALGEGARTPRCLAAFEERGERVIVLEDLQEAGYTERPWTLNAEGMSVALGWLARFHAHFLGVEGDGLWEAGTYWHLKTRPEELANIEGTRLHALASFLDACLRKGGFPTLVHGDAKLANFLFTADQSDVAAVDFQYVGVGAAMKDVSYFIGSCLSGPECEQREGELLDLYFDALRRALPEAVDAAALEHEWRALYPFAWADFQRFMLGWSPGHRKLSAYSDVTSERVMDALWLELASAAREACLEAGRYIQSQRGRPFEVGSKGLAGRASDVVTEIDLQAQRIILSILAPSIERYDLGVLAEEGEHDDTRLHKHAFWTIDPLDGTQYYIDGAPGYATSIALVSQSGESLLAAVYDPVHDALYEAVRGQGVTLNGDAFVDPVDSEDASKGMTWLGDRSLPSYPYFPQVKAHFDLRFCGGAVRNALQLLNTPQSIYAKPPKRAKSGCAIWDLAAVALLVEERGGSARTFHGERLSLNRPESVFFNDIGFVLSGEGVDIEALLGRLEALVE